MKRFRAIIWSDGGELKEVIEADAIDKADFKDYIKGEFDIKGDYIDIQSIKEIKEIKGVPFEDGVNGIRFGDGYFYATRGGEGSFTPYFTVEEVLSMQARGEIVSVTLSDVELNEAGEIKYLFGYWEER